MEVKDIHVDNLLRFAAENYGFNKTTCSLMAEGRDKNKRLYTFLLRDKAYILRIVRCTANHLDQTKAEMNWLTYLEKCGASVPRPLVTRSGALALLYETMDDTVVLSAFSLTKGQCWDKDNPDLWNEDIFYHWGRAVGDLHRLSKGYTPANDVQKRFTFSLRDMFGENLQSFPSVKKILDHLLDEINNLPKNTESYGLIHNDLHPDNFLIDGERVYLIDFDDCAYSWYVFDLANALYLALWFGRKNSSGLDFTDNIIKYFLMGYQAVVPLSNFWLSKIPLFMMACKIALFSLGCDCENPENGFSASHQRERLHNIENNILFSDCVIDISMFYIDS